MDRRLGIAGRRRIRRSIAIPIDLWIGGSEGLRKRFGIRLGNGNGVSQRNGLGRGEIRRHIRVPKMIADPRGRQCLSPAAFTAASTPAWHSVKTEPSDRPENHAFCCQQADIAERPMASIHHHG